MITRRILLASAAGVTAARAARAANLTRFRILTGGTSGLYFPVGGLIASAISGSGEAGACWKDGHCGVPGVVGMPKISSGSVANVAAIASGAAESGFVQSDIAYWAYTGTGVYREQPKVEQLRAIASLYPESIHLVARKGSGIQGVRDLRGKKVSLDEPGSGTLADARIVLAAYGLTERDVQAVYVSTQRAADMFRDGSIDAFFRVSGWPESAIADLARSVGIELVPIVGPEATKLIGRRVYFVPNEVPAGVYQGVPAVSTIGVMALWVTSSRQPDELIYKITAALWDPAARRLLDSGPAKAREIQLRNALAGIGIPLHPGAERFYKEKDLIK
ncbi:MAG: TAXI family TRAP transporter solute-binding subunit [Proteobacteria bacterium]|nr:TAXI family TRAP transporter solute-binding subunit [Pseudomonadota bacterium]